MLQQAADKMDELLDDIYKYIFWHIMTQMTATAGIKKHGQAGRLIAGVLSARQLKRF